MLNVAADFVALKVTQFLVWLMRTLPAAASFQIARFMIRLIMLPIPRLMHVGRRNLDLVFPEKTAEEKEEILQESISVLARNVMSFARAGRLTKDDFAQHSNAVSIAAKMKVISERNKERGILIAVPHFGSFEMALYALSLFYRPPAVLARGFGLPRFDSWCNQRRESCGAQMFGRKGAVPEIIRRLKSGQDVVVLFDQNVKRNHAVFVDLFGMKAATTKTMGIAALRAGSPLVFAACFEEPLGHYEFTLDEVVVDYHSSLPLDRQVEIITRELNRHLEESVYHKPDHWYWIHRRFKTRPLGEPENVYDSRVKTRIHNRRLL